MKTEIQISAYNREGIPEDIRFFDGELPPDRKALVAKSGDRIVGVLSFVDVSFAYPDFVGVAVVSVSPEYKNQGVATRLVSEIFDRAMFENYYGVRFSHYEPEGEKYLKPVVRKIAKARNLRLIEGFKEFDFKGDVKW